MIVLEYLDLIPDVLLVCWPTRPITNSACPLLSLLILSSRSLVYDYPFHRPTNCICNWNRLLFQVRVYYNGFEFAKQSVDYMCDQSMGFPFVPFAPAANFACAVLTADLSVAMACSEFSAPKMAVPATTTLLPR